MKKFKRFSIFLLVGVLLFSLLFPACGTNTGNHSNTDTTSESSDLSNNEEAPTGPFYTLEEAYTCGLLTKEDLEKAASYDYAASFNFKDFNEEFLTEVKVSWANELQKNPSLQPEKINYPKPEEVAEHVFIPENVYIHRFYGAYNDCYIFCLYYNRSSIFTLDKHIKVDICGVTFSFLHPIWAECMIAYKR